MKTMNHGKMGNERLSTPSKKGATNPKKPNNDPDQTPNREVENEPKAKPDKPSQKNKVGFKK